MSHLSDLVTSLITVLLVVSAFAVHADEGLSQEQRLRRIEQLKQRIKSIEKEELAPVAQAEDTSKKSVKGGKNDFEIQKDLEVIRQAKKVFKVISEKLNVTQNADKNG